MGLFSRRTPVGVTRQNTPDLHLADDAPASMAGLTDDGDEFTDPAPVVARATRTWRAVSQGTTRADVGLSDTQEARAAAHTERGTPDARRNDLVPNGNAAAPEAPYAAAVDHPRNARADVAIDHKAAPARPRAGFTGEDPTRVARFQPAFLVRPFDKFIAEHPGSIDKAPLAAPLAARPPERKRLTGARPSASGATGTGMTPVGPQRNTFRLTPKPWDEQLVNTGQPAAATTARGRGWRAR